jgi:hypothetical protein
MAIAAERAVPPAVLVPRHELAVEVTVTALLEALFVVPLQLVALPSQVRPSPLVEVPVQLVAFLWQERPTPLVEVPVQLVALKQ